MSKFRNKELKRTFSKEEKEEDIEIDLDFEDVDDQNNKVMQEEHLINEKRNNFSPMKFKFTPHEQNVMILANVMDNVIKYGSKVGADTDDINDLKKMKSTLEQYYFLVRPLFGKMGVRFFDTEFKLIREGIREHRPGTKIDRKLHDKLLNIQRKLWEWASNKRAIFMCDLENRIGKVEEKITK